jgi:hypothetical protein
MLAAVAGAVSIASVAASTVASVVAHIVLNNEDTDSEGENDRVPLYRHPIPYRTREFSLDHFTEESAIEYFRFSISEIRTILPYLGLEGLRYRNRLKASPEKAFCLVLYRLSAPNRFKENLAMFGRSRAYQSIIFNDVVCHLASRYKTKMFWDPRRLTIDRLRMYAQAIGACGGVSSVWGFIDGTQRGICRPSEDQREWYSGYKKAHTIKYQAIMTPDGIISHIAGPYEGRLGDWGAWKASEFATVLRGLLDPLLEEERLYLYGDPAYSCSYGVIGAYKATVSAGLTPEQQGFNRDMSALRISVEHGFGKVMNLWRFNAFSRDLKIGLSPVAAYFIVAVLLTNIHTSLRGSQTSVQFNMQPPPLDEYLRLD